MRRLWAKCGGLCRVDEDTTLKKDLRWVRLQTRSVDLRKIPRVVQVSDEELKYDVSIVVEEEWDEEMQLGKFFGQNGYLDDRRWYSEVVRNTSLVFDSNKTTNDVGDSISKFKPSKEPSRRPWRETEDKREKVSYALGGRLAQNEVKGYKGIDKSTSLLSANQNVDSQNALKELLKSAEGDIFRRANKAL